MTLDLMVTGLGLERPIGIINSLWIRQAILELEANAKQNIEYCNYTSHLCIQWSPTHIG